MQLSARYGHSSEELASDQTKATTHGERHEDIALRAAEPEPQSPFWYVRLRFCVQVLVYFYNLSCLSCERTTCSYLPEHGAGTYSARQAASKLGISSLGANLYTNRTYLSFTHSSCAKLNPMGCPVQKELKSFHAANTLSLQRCYLILARPRGAREERRTEIESAKTLDLVVYKLLLGGSSARAQR